MPPRTKETDLPAFRNYIILEIARGLRAFLKLDAGLVRGAVPDLERMLEQAQSRVERRDRELERTHRELAETHRQLERAHRLLEETRRRLSETEERAVDEILSYEAAWEALIQESSADVAIGANRPFDLIGRLLLAVLTEEGLEPAATLVDLGCGTGRLAVHAIPYLVGGHYIGIDIARTMLDEAQERVESTVPDSPGRVSWIHQISPAFALDAGSVDMICAFSVFTHMEHEDSYLYLKEALRIVRPGGRFVFSCLPVDTTWGEEVFLGSAGRDPQTRYRTVRNVSTSRDLMEEIARLAGWTPIRWRGGDEEDIRMPGDDEPHKFRQTICVLEAPGP
jgi:ubiquinone/menaquinone biosynthesis C-methylase UbiE